jgi:hypothetical protein
MSLDVGVEGSASDVVQSASGGVETADKVTSTIESVLSPLPDISKDSDAGVLTGKYFKPTIPFLQYPYTATALQPFNDSTGFDDYQDSFLLSDQDTSNDTDLLPIPSDFEFEPADETIERDVSLIPYQHYSPPSESIHS